MAVRTKRRDLSPAVAAEQAEERQRKIEAAHGQLSEGIAKLVNGEDWRAMLAASARFHTYSWRNVVLILEQRPDATKVAGYRAWQGFGRQVRKGERGIAVIAPVTYRKTETEQTDHGQNEVDDSAPRVRGWRVEHVFDVSQTEGEELPNVRPAVLEGEGPAGLWDALAAQISAEGFSLVREAPPHSPSALGSVDRSQQLVRVRPDLPKAEACLTLAHERAHMVLGHGTEACTDPRSRREVEAESVAFIVASSCGLDASGASFPYVAGWAKPGEEAEAVAETAERVISAARQILDAIPE